MPKPTKKDDRNLEQLDLKSAVRLNQRQGACERIAIETRRKVSSLLIEAMRLLEDAGYGAAVAQESRASRHNGVPPRPSAKAPAHINGTSKRAS